jgi:hypothetical protein
MNFVRHFLVIDFQQFDGLFQWFEHLIGRLLTVLYSHQDSHDRHQSVVVAFFQRLSEFCINLLNEGSQVFQAVKNRTQILRHSQI